MLKQFTVLLDDDDQITGVETVSLVEFPAIQSNFVTLKNEPVEIELAKDAKKQWVTGPVLIPDVKIPRQYDNINDGEPFHLVFSAEQIEKINLRFHKNQYTHSTNDEHSIPLDGNYMVESWIVQDPENDKSVALGLSEQTAGTWMATYHIPDNDYWNDQIMSGKRSGFSIEGLFNFIESEPIQMKKNETKLAEITLADGTVLQKNEITGKISFSDNGGIVPDGVYTMDDGTMFKVETSQYAWEVKPEELEASKQKLAEAKGGKSNAGGVADAVFAKLKDLFSPKSDDSDQDDADQDDTPADDQGNAKVDGLEKKVTELSKQIGSIPGIIKAAMEDVQETGDSDDSDDSDDAGDADPEKEKRIKELETELAKLNATPAATPVEKDTGDADPVPMKAHEKALARAKESQNFKLN